MTSSETAASADGRYLADGRPMFEIAPHHYVNKESAIALGFIRGTYRQKGPPVAANDNKPDLPSKFHVLALDGKLTEWRHMPLTVRLRRYQEIVKAFEDIVVGRVLPTRYERASGIPILRDNDCPPQGWRERATAIWAMLPANDSDIFDRPAVTEKPKLGHLADRLAPLLKWARARKPLPLAATNWLEADNDSYFDGEEPAPKPASNRERRIRPGSTDAELKSFIKAYKDGKLRLSNGEQRESCYVMKNDKAVLSSVLMPTGAILYQPDKFGELLGSEPNPDEQARRLSYWTKLFAKVVATDDDEGWKNRHEQELEPVRHIKAGRMRRKVLFTAEDHQRLLAGPRPPITYCKPGLPCGHDDIGAQFVGGWISQTKGKAGTERWQDVSDELSRQAELDRWANALPLEEQTALNLACTAANLQEIGEAFGKVGKNAERYGKKILLAANDNLQKVMAA
jgi:hypothetical protein